MDYKALYTSNEDFEDYVNRYCQKHRITVDEAITHAVVRAYGDIWEKAVNKGEKH